MKKSKVFFKRAFSLFAILNVMFLFVASSAFAQTPTFVTQGVDLAKDALGWILILVPVTAGTMLGYHAWRKSMADGDAGEIAARNDKMKRVIIGSVIAEISAGVVTLVLSYFS